MTESPTRLERKTSGDSIDAPPELQEIALQLKEHYRVKTAKHKLKFNSLREILLQEHTEKEAFAE